jgi:hypothetical protein
MFGGHEYPSSEPDTLSSAVFITNIAESDFRHTQESPREGQCPAVPSGYEHPPRRACSMPRAAGRTLALLPSGGSVNGTGASNEFFDHSVLQKHM